MVKLPFYATGSDPIFIKFELSVVMDSNVSSFISRAVQPTSGPERSGMFNQRDREGGWGGRREGGREREREREERELRTSGVLMLLPNRNASI